MAPQPEAFMTIASSAGSRCAATRHRYCGGHLSSAPPGSSVWWRMRAAAAAARASDQPGCRVSRARARWPHRCWVPGSAARSPASSSIRRACCRVGHAPGVAARRNLRAQCGWQQRAQQRDSGPGPVRTSGPAQSRAHQRRASRCASGRRTRCCATSRPMSTRRPYCTPDGQVVSQFRQVRQRSRCSCVLLCRRRSFEHLLDQIDAPARAIEFVAEQLVGRAGGGAEAAVHAAAQDGLGFVARGGVRA